MQVPISPYYWPRGRPERLSFLRNFKERIAEHGGNLGLKEEEVGACRADLAYYVWVLQELNPAVSDFAERVNDFTEHTARGESVNAMAQPTFPTLSQSPEPQPAGVLNRLFSLITRILVAPGYNEMPIGKDLGLLRSQAPAAIERPAPNPASLDLTTGDGRQLVKIGFKKYGHDGVAIDSKRNDGPWEFLAVDNASPHLDDRPLLVPGVPETRQYRLRWWDKGNAHGDWSEVRSISVTG